MTALAFAAGRGDDVAAGRFVRASQAEVWRLLAHLANRDVADDLTQETYLRAFGALPRFRGESSARTWLLAIARRVAADHLRSRDRRPQGVAVDAPDLPVAGADPADHVPVSLLLARLDSDRREVFVLTQLLGLSYAEAGEVCGCPVGTVRSRVARARADLVDALGGGSGRVSG